jgi:predicted membrane GTPase involved in stress response
MIILISGSREYSDLEFVKEYVKLLPSDTILLNGRARGVDNVARNTALFNDIRVRDYPAEWRKYGKGAGFIRNHIMVDLAELIICFWDGESPGTKDVIDYSLQQNKPLVVYNKFCVKEEFNTENIEFLSKPLEVENGWE